MDEFELSRWRNLRGPRVLHLLGFAFFYRVNNHRHRCHKYTLSNTQGFDSIRRISSIAVKTLSLIISTGEDPVLLFRFAFLFETMTSHGDNEDVNEYTRSVLEWLSGDATHRKIFVDTVVAVFRKETLSPEPGLVDLASLDEDLSLIHI